MDRATTYLNVIPATPIADSNIWRVVLQYHEHYQDERIDVTDAKAREKYIRDWCEKVSVDFAYGLWIYGAIDEGVGDWLKRTDELKVLREHVNALIARVEHLTEQAKAADERYEKMRKWVLENVPRKGNGNGD
jgi:hypothetical protein